VRTHHTLTGADGIVWDISDLTSGVFLTRDGIRGMGRPAWILHQSTSPVVHGARYHGHVAPPRPAHLPLYVYHDGSSQEWTDLYRAFMRSMRPDFPIRWTVTHPDSGSRRSLMMRFTDPGDDVESVDSRWRGWKRIGLNFVADEQPFWEGPAVTQVWQQAPQVDFFDAGGSPPFHLSQALTLADASVSNPGDEAAWPVWDITGPVQSVTVGVGDKLVVAPIVLAEGETLRLDSRPGRKSAYDGMGQRRTAELTVRDWRPIPSGETVPLTLAMDGSGSVRVSITSLYHEAY
jgi:hypothetical protein